MQGKQGTRYLRVKMKMQSDRERVKPMRVMWADSGSQQEAFLVEQFKRWARDHFA